MILPVPRSFLVEPKIKAAKIELLDAHFATAMLGFWLASILVASAIVSIDGDLSIMLWASLVGAVCALGYWGRRHIPDRASPRYADFYTDCMVVVVAVLGSLWGIGALYFLSIRSDQAHPVMQDVLSVMSVVAGISTAATGLLASSRSVVASFLITLVLPIWGFFLWSELPAGFPLLWGIPLYVGVLLLFAHHSALGTERAIRLRFENEELLARLQQESERAATACKDAENANREKSVTLASASHDLRQPLHALGLFLIALGRTELSDKQRVLLDHIQSSSSAAQDMLNILLDYSRLETGRIRPRPRDFPIQSLLFKLEKEFAPDAEARNLVYRSRDTKLWAYADVNLVDQILRNLISNAIRYTEHGGLLVVCRKHHGQLVCEVWDTGVGIPETQHEAIFREFYQLNNPEQDRRKGLGLGLSIVARLARIMDSTVTLSSRSGRGSVFRLKLPVGIASAEEMPDSSTPSDTERSLNGLCVLVIDDDEHVRMAMQSLLESWECPSRAVESERSAVDLIASGWVPDLIVADYRLRDHRTGSEAIARIRELLDRPLPALIITGETHPERIREIEASGLDVLPKPVDEGHLCSMMTGVLARRASNQGRPPGSAGEAVKV